MARLDPTSAGARNAKQLRYSRGVSIQGADPSQAKGAIPEVGMGRQGPDRPPNPQLEKAAENAVEIENRALPCYEEQSVYSPAASQWGIYYLMPKYPSSKMKPIHTPYEEKFGFPPDFRVKYSLLTPEQGGRKRPASQGIRWDYWYDAPGHHPTSIYMIWPEFEDESGEPLPKGHPITPSGTAKMWIVFAEYRSYHKSRIQLGDTGFFREVGLTTGICQVVEIVGLHTNPAKAI